MPQARGKKYKEAAKAIERDEQYAPDEAVRAGVQSLFTPVPGNEVTTKVGHFNAFPIKPGSAVVDDKIDAHVGGYLSNVCIACMPWARPL